MQRNTRSVILFNKRPIFYLLQLLLFAIVCSNCGVKKHLEEGQYLVVENKIVLTEKKLKNERQSTLEYELSTLAKPKPNSKAMALFRTGLWAYYRTDEPQDTSSTKNFLRKKIAEKPAFYKDEIAESSAQAMTNFLIKKGYFNANVIPEETIFPKRKLAKVNYYVTLGERFYTDTIQYLSIDPLLQAWMDTLETTSLLRKGEPVSENLYYQEVQRITDTLRNNGFAYFYGNYMSVLESDSTNNKKNLNIDMVIRRPSEGEHHRQYRVGEITFYPNYQVSTLNLEMRDTLIQGINFKIPKGEDIKINPKVILKQLFLKEGQLFRQADFNKTNELLGNLGVFKFINLEMLKNEKQEGIVDFNIYLTQNKQRSIGVETELNNSFRSTLNTSGRIFSLGGGVNLNYQNRNTFGGGELLSMILEGGLEVNFTDENVRVNSREILARTDLYFPKFINYLGYWKWLNKVDLVTDNYYKDLREKARSRVSVSYNYQDFLDFYTFNTFNISLGYNLTRKANERIIIDQTGIDIFVSEIRDSFQMIVDNNQFLERSLGEDQLFTGFLYRDMNYTWTSKIQPKGGAWQFRITHELSGLEMLGINYLANKLSKPLQIRNSSFAHYTRMDADLRYHRNFLNNRKFAFRWYAGIAAPFGKLTTDVPYVKQYFIGGPSSVRAWLVRQLGPGSYYDSNNQQPPYYQAADFKMEFNAEYRFDLIPYILLEGALFLDGGNIWTLREDTERVGSQLQGDFIQEFAIGGGVGFRFDFSFFIIRLDMGYKLRTPYIDENGKNWQLYQFKDYTVWDYFRPSNVNYNLGIGYPF